MNETRCEECGAPVEDDMDICYWCAQRNQELENEVNEVRAMGRSEEP